MLELPNICGAVCSLRSEKYKRGEGERGDGGGEWREEGGREGRWMTKKSAVKSSIPSIFVQIVGQMIVSLITPQNVKE